MNSWIVIGEWMNRVGMLFEFASFWLGAPELLGDKRLKAIEDSVELLLERVPRLLNLFFWIFWIFSLGGGLILSYLLVQESWVPYPEARSMFEIVLLWGSIITIISVDDWVRGTQSRIVDRFGIKRPMTTNRIRMLFPYLILSYALTYAYRFKLIYLVPFVIVAAIIHNLMSRIQHQLPLKSKFWYIIPLIMHILSIGFILGAFLVVGKDTRLPTNGNTLGLGYYEFYWFTIVVVSLGVYGLVQSFILFVSEMIIPLLEYLANDEEIRRRYIILGAIILFVGFLLQMLSTFVN